MPISSFIVACFEKGCEEVQSFIEGESCYQLLGREGTSIAVLSESRTLDDEYDLAQKLASLSGVREIKILFHHVG
jgi:hypothetical protein